MVPIETIRERLAKLQLRLKQSCYWKHVKDMPLVSDNQHDYWMMEMRDLVDRYPELDNIALMIHRVPSSSALGYSNEEKIGRVMIDIDEAQVICGFPGVGKSTLVAAGAKAVDLDSSLFSRDKDYPVNYIKSVETHIDEPRFAESFILCGTHFGFMNRLSSHGIPHYVVYPDPDSVKFEDWVARYEQRNDTKEWIDYMKEQWDTFMLDIEKHISMNGDTAIPVKLKKEQVLSDFL